MGTIRVLDDLTIDKIAAGEVVEDPASVIKELVENSIDAGAKRIGVEITSGGIDRIVIKDDGYGMKRDDALLSFERHATSKIRQFQDLLGVSSMGFRGEALASISAVAKVEMKTRAEGDVLGQRLVNHGGKLLMIEPCSRNVGTMIEVRELFYNVPARRKFQKSVASMTAKVMRVITRMILAYPEVEFKLFRGLELYISSAPSLHLAPKNALEEQVRRVLGEESLTSMRYIECKNEGLSLYGFMGIPRVARKNRGGQYIFLNKRAIYSPALSQSLKSAFATTIGTHEYPTAVLHLEIERGEIDVNVHPQKHEVRFSHFPKIDQLMLKAYNLCMQRSVIPSIEVNQKDVFTFEEIANKVTYQNLKIDHDDPFKSIEPTTQEKVFDLDDGLAYLGIHHHFLFATVLPHASIYREGRSLMLVNLRALEENIFIEKSLFLLKNRKASHPLQALLFPETLEYSAVEVIIIQEHLEKLRCLGVGLKPFGKNCFLLEELSKEIDPEKVRDVIIELIESDERTLLTIIRKIRHQKRVYTLDEAKTALKLYMSKECSAFSISGNKILSFLSFSELERLM